MESVTGRKADDVSLKVRIENFKRVSNAAFDKLKDFYDRSSVWKRYVDESLQVEMTFRIGNSYFSGVILKCDLNMSVHDDRAFPPTAHARQAPMLVWVGDVTQGFSPCASYIRLQRLDTLDVSNAQPIQTVLSSRIKTVLIVFDEELGATLGATGVLDCEFVNKIIKGGPQVVNDFPNQDGNVFWDADGLILNADNQFLAWLENKLVRVCSVFLGEQFILVYFRESVNKRFELMDVDIGPVNPLECPVQRMSHDNSESESIIGV